MGTGKVGRHAGSRSGRLDVAHRLLSLSLSLSQTTGKHGLHSKKKEYKRGRSTKNRQARGGPDRGARSRSLSRGEPRRAGSATPIRCTTTSKRRRRRARRRRSSGTTTCRVRWRGREGARVRARSRSRVGGAGARARSLQTSDGASAGGGQFYCVETGKHFLDQHALDSHKKSREFKRRRVTHSCARARGGRQKGARARR